VSASPDSGTAPASSVGAVVRTARAGLRAARLLECALFFAAGAFLARGAALTSGAENGAEDGAWSMAFLCGALAAASWWLEHPSALDATARKLDARLGHGGALALAFELEERGSARPLGLLEELVVSRVRTTLRAGAALRAVLPSFFVPLAAPVVAGLVLLLVMDRRGAGEERTGDLRALGAAVERALASGLGPAAGEPGRKELELREAVHELCGRLEAFTAASAAPGERRRAADEARASLERLDGLVAEIGRGEGRGERGESTREARSRIDALRAALASGAGGDSGEETSTGPLTGAPADGTISRPMSGQGALPAPDPATTPTTALGLQAGSFWPREYDEVVARWIELSRAAQSGGR